MNYLFKITFLILLFGCYSEPNAKTILVNKSIKVYSEEYHKQAENYIFKWHPPIGPDNKRIKFNLVNDMLIFTPTNIGIYEIKLTIEDISEEIISEEVFYYSAIPETLISPIIEDKDTINKLSILAESDVNNTKKNITDYKQNNITRKSQKNIKQTSAIKKNKYKNNIQYAIQLSSWPTLEEARNQQLYLIEEGYDAYTQKFYLKKTDQVWYRVRVGDYDNKKKAMKIKNELELLMKLKTWLDATSSN